MSRTSQILVASFQLQHSPYPLRLVILLVVAGAVNAYLLPSVFAQPHKYTHGTLVSALNGRHLNAVGGGLELAGPVADTGGGGGGGLEVATAVLDGPASGGEVLVPKTYPIGAQEPTCEQLRAMWIFSKRQSRAAEITNEIPTYRDPFAYNIWEPYYTAGRGMSSYRFVPRYGERTRSPVFGRVISLEPLVPQHIPVTGHRQRHYNEEGISGGAVSGSNGRLYGSEYKGTYAALSGGNGVSRRPSQYRYLGANGSTVPGGGDRTAANNPNSAAVQGSFQKLKELIWTERAKELTQQRRAEELAARAAVLKEIANGQNIMSNYKPPIKSESMLMDANRSPHHDPAYQHDERMSIASGQSYTKHTTNSNINNNNNKNNGKNEKGDNSNNNSNLNKNGFANSGNSSGKGNANSGNRGSELNYGSSTRRSFDSNMQGGVNKMSNGDDKSIHFGRSGNGGRMILPATLVGSYSNGFVGAARDVGSHDGNRNVGYDVADELTRERDRDYGIPRAFPMRPSHFRERNRSLYGMQRHGDYFERDIRQIEEDAANVDNDNDADVTSLERLIDNLNDERLATAAYVDGGGDDSSSFEDFDASVGDLFDTVDYSSEGFGDTFNPASMLLIAGSGAGDVGDAGVQNARPQLPTSLRGSYAPSWRIERQPLMPAWSGVYDTNNFF